jgi:hypothetical protein
MTKPQSWMEWLGIRDREKEVNAKKIQDSSL